MPVSQRHTNAQASREAVAWFEQLVSVLDKMPEGVELLYNPSGSQLSLVDPVAVREWGHDEDAAGGPPILAISEPAWRLSLHPQA
jgi:hypothetical protein